MKEQILKEFDEKLEKYDKDGGFIVYIEGYDNTDFDVDLMREFLSQAINKVQSQTREETIREVERVLPEEKECLFINNKPKHFINTWNDLLKEIKEELNKLKK